MPTEAPLPPVIRATCPQHGEQAFVLEEPEAVAPYWMCPSWARDDMSSPWCKAWLPYVYVEANPDGEVPVLFWPDEGDDDEFAELVRSRR